MRISDIKKGTKFIAVHRITGEKALYGGICTAVKPPTCTDVVAIDATGLKRIFSRNQWAFSERK